jgi:lysozyme
MKTNKAGIDLIESFESCQLKAYKCPAGVWTIGFGHTNGVKEGQTISRIQAIELLASDLHKFEVGVSVLIKSQLTENQFSALVSFTFNVGIGALQRSSLLNVINKNPNDNFIDFEFNRWNKANGKVLAGLTRRRKAESKLYFTK